MARLALHAAGRAGPACSTAVRPPGARPACSQGSSVPRDTSLCRARTKQSALLGFIRKKQLKQEDTAGLTASVASEHFSVVLLQERAIDRMSYLTDVKPPSEPFWNSSKADLAAPLVPQVPSLPGSEIQRCWTYVWYRGRTIGCGESHRNETNPCCGQTDLQAAAQQCPAPPPRAEPGPARSSAFPVLHHSSLLSCRSRFFFTSALILNVGHRCSILPSGLSSIGFAKFW